MIAKYEKEVQVSREYSQVKLMLVIVYSLDIYFLLYSLKYLISGKIQFLLLSSLTAEWRYERHRNGSLFSRRKGNGHFLYAYYVPAIFICILT